MSPRYNGTNGGRGSQQPRPAQERSQQPRMAAPPRRSGGILILKCAAVGGPGGSGGQRPPMDGNTPSVNRSMVKAPRVNKEQSGPAAHWSPAETPSNVHHQDQQMVDHSDGCDSVPNQGGHHLGLKVVDPSTKWSQVQCPVPQPSVALLLTFRVLRSDLTPQAGFVGTCVFLGKIRSEPLRWPDRDSRAEALHELMPNLNSIFFFTLQW